MWYIIFRLGSKKYYSNQRYKMYKGKIYLNLYSEAQLLHDIQR